MSLRRVVHAGETRQRRASALIVSPDRLARALALAASALFLGVFLVAALLRLSHPYDLEWLEGWMLEHVERLRHGQALYPPPSLAFIPANYTPLYWQACARAGDLAHALGLGSGLPAMRAVSVAAALGSIAWIAHLVRRDTGNLAAGWIAAGLFAATYARDGFWLDLARADSLFLLLMLGALAAMSSRDRGVARALLGGVLLGGAALTRQSAVVAMAPAVAFQVIRAPRQGLALAGAALAVAGGTAMLWQHASGGWFGFYVFRVALAHDPNFASLPAVARSDLVPLLPIGIAAAWALAGPARGGRGLTMAIAGGWIGSAIYLRIHPGAWTNTLIPAHAALAIGGGLAWANAEARAAGTAVARRSAHVARGLVLLQFALLLYDPRPALPTAADRAAGDALVARLGRESGPVLVLSHGGLAEAAGHGGQAHEMGLADLLGTGGPAAPAIQDSLVVAVRQRRWSAVVVDHQESEERLVTLLAAGYAPAETLVHDESSLWTRSGARTRPETLWRPRVAP